MDYTTRANYPYDQNDNNRQYPTVSKLGESPNSYRFPAESRQPEPRNYERPRSTTGDPHSVSQLVIPNTSRPNNNYEPSNRVPTSNYGVDQYRRPATARPAAVDISITITVGGNRGPRASYVTANPTTRQTPPIRSQAVIDDARYIDLTYYSPQRSARIATDGYIRNQPPQKSVAFSNGDGY